MDTHLHIDQAQRRIYIRPLIVSIALTSIGEMLLLIIYGLLLFPAGNILNKIVWTLVFCGIGMCASLGTFISIFIAGKFDGVRGVLATVASSFIMLGLICNWLCLNLDRNFHYFGRISNPGLFTAGNVSGSLVGGLNLGILLFTSAGNRYLEKLGL